MAENTRHTCAEWSAHTAYFCVRSINPALVPIFVDLINLSYNDCTVPAHLKHSNVTPLLKRSGLPVDDYSSYRPIANRRHASKFLERDVAAQIRLHIQCNNIGDPLQSAYRSPHSVETAIGCIQDDVLRSLMLVSTLFSFYSIWAQRLTRLTTKSFSRNYIESAFNVTHIAGSSLTWPTERSASVSMTIFLAWFYRNIEFHRAVFWALSFSLCIMLMRMTPSYTLTSSQWFCVRYRPNTPVRYWRESVVGVTVPAIKRGEDRSHTVCSTESYGTTISASNRHMWKWRQDVCQHPWPWRVSWLHNVDQHARYSHMPDSIRSITKHSAYKIISTALSMQHACARARDLNTRLRERGIVRDNGKPNTSTRDGATSSSACRPLFWPTGPSKHDGGATWTSLATDSTAIWVQSVDAYAWCRA